MKTSVRLFFLFFVSIPLFQGFSFAGASVQEETAPLVKFLAQNITENEMPLSYKPPKDYWRRINHPSHDVDAVIERLITTYGLSVYDGALWQIVMARSGNIEKAAWHTENLLSNSYGSLFNIRGWDDFTYGGKKLPLENAYFFRLISDRYHQADPLDGKTKLTGFPTWPELHHEDWKPVTGENSWAAIIGPLQAAYVRYDKTIPLDSREVKLAMSILPAVEALQSPIGGIYYAPENTYGVEPEYISVENNISMLAALRMLAQVLEKGESGELSRVRRLAERIEFFLGRYAYDPETHVFRQGGHYKKNQWIYTKEFAVDCQTWGIAVLGGAWIDECFGDGAAMRIWIATKEHAGYFDAQNPDELRGFGYTDGHDIFSGEWSYGGILAAKELARYYGADEPEWSKTLSKDISSLSEGARSLKVPMEDGAAAYKYSNVRHYIVFGWWANPIPSIASTAWAFFHATNFNPFVLGGGAEATLVAIPSENAIINSL